MDLFHILNEEGKRIAKEKWADDGCPPKFWISNLIEKDEHKILLTVKHRGLIFSTVLFPQIDKKYGYEDLEQEMERLYNRTM